MKKLQKSSELLWVLGMLFVGLGVAICSKTNLGVSMVAAPAFLLYDAFSPFWDGFTVGMIEYAVQGILLLVLSLSIRRFRWRFLLAFASAVLYGFVLDFFLFLLSGVTFDAIWLRWLMFFVGNFSIAFGVACFFKTYLPRLAFELFVVEFTKHYKLNINKFKWVIDGILLAVSLTLAFTLFDDITSFDWSTIGYSSFHHIGMGTLVATLVTAPMIALSSKIIGGIFDPTPAFPKGEAFFTKE